MNANKISCNQVFKYDNGVVIRQYDFASDTFKRIEFVECGLYQPISYSGGTVSENCEAATCLNSEGKSELLLIKLGRVEHCRSVRKGSELKIKTFTFGYDRGYGVTAEIFESEKGEKYAVIHEMENFDETMCCYKITAEDDLSLSDDFMRIAIKRADKVYVNR
ncbi:MAG: hypothetical protein IJZ59_08215 [Alphaproteobacteria bacterium]|nr:hypothetical protein [Alphaproteobacteria bacterium]